MARTEAYFSVDIEADGPIPGPYSMRKRQMPAALLSDRPHTHDALDDAVEQAELFQNLMRWDG